MSCRTWHLRYACCLDTASAMTLVSCLGSSKNNFMNVMKRRDLWRTVQASIHRGRSRHTEGKAHTTGCHSNETLFFNVFFIFLVVLYGQRRSLRHWPLGRASIGLYLVDRAAALATLRVLA
ncbi:hypothetical protein ISCGN_029842 [Ixodes scapularis]